ncbi:MAG: HAD hydrolase-like protein [Pseudomonadales bacterium]
MLPPKFAAMIGDGQMDMRVGKQLGMLCAGVLSGSSSLERLQEAGADIVLDSVRGLTCQVT